MDIIARGESSTPQVPLLSTYILLGGVPFAPSVVEYAIYERATEEFPKQVYPEVEGERAVADLATAPLGDWLPPCRYVARWTAPVTAWVGRYEVRWWYRTALTDPPELEYTHVETFEVLTHRRAKGPAYAFVADLRAEGVDRDDLDDPQLHHKIVRASLLFEQYTGRIFRPLRRTLRAVGRGHSMFALGEPIIALIGLQRDGSSLYGAPYRYGTAPLRVYNRHITEGLTQPDDRENPRIELGRYGHERFARSGTVVVDGIFGYTDYVQGGPPAGDTPELVQHAVKLLTFRDLPKLWDVAEREDAQKRWKLTSESTRDQSYGMLGGVDAATRGALVGSSTGDPEIDNIILMYRKAPGIGAA